MRSCFLLILLFAVASTLLAGEQTAKSFANEAMLRKQKMLQYAAVPDGRRTYFYQITARLALEQEVERCQKDFAVLLVDPSGDMFYSLPLMGAYLHGWQYWSPEIHQKVREVWKTYLPARGDTENHWVMWHTALLLAAQTWPDLPGSEWANGRSSQENYDDAAGFLDFWFETTSTIGQGEFDSPDYLPEYLGALFVLYDFVKDPVLKQRAEMALDWLLADYAIDYLDGAYTGGHSRIYEPRIVDGLSDGARDFGYLFFGDTPFPTNTPRAFSIFAAVSSFHLPEVIREIATDRDTPYIARKRKRVRNVIRFGIEKNPPVFKYNYMTKNFSLGSLDGGLQQPIQIHAWDVTYIYNEDRADNLFSLHPYYSAYELGMFFPEELKMMVEDVVKSKGTYDKEDKWTGGSPYERTFQHKNALIVLYNLAKDTPWKHIDYYFPKSLTRREEDQSGWVFAQGGAAYIAVRPFKPGEWRVEDSCFRLRSPHLKNGSVTVVEDASAFASWDEFKNKIRQTQLDLSRLDSQVAVTYTTLAGDKLGFAFPGERTLNGRKIDLSSTPLFESPYLNGNAGVLHVQHDSLELVVDFNKNEIVKKVSAK